MLCSLLRFSSLLHPRAIPFAAPKSSTSLLSLSIPRIKIAMASGGGRDEAPPVDPLSSEKVTRIQELLAGDPLGGWKECWKEGITPWDLGQPTPVILHLLETGSLPKGRVFIPGCGTGYDVVAIAGPERYVVGLDISEVAAKKAEELFASSENSKYFKFVAADFFTWRSSELFDLVIDYTFFCAIDPCLRPAWAAHVQEILKPEGELLTLIFPIGEYDGGPPYAVSLSTYEDVLHPLGFRAVSVVDNKLAIGPRKGREKLARWKRTVVSSLL